MLRSVAVVLTTACNLRCGYCYQRRGRAEMMPWRVLREAIALLLRGGAAEPELVFHGGEPLVALPLMRRAAAYLRGHAPPGVRPRMAVVTNGTLLDDDALAFLAGHRVRTFISLDGVGPAQELRAPGTFPALDALLTRLRTEYPIWMHDDLTVAITLTSANLPYLSQSVAYLLGRAVAAIAISPLLTADPDWSERCLEALEHQLGETARLGRDHLARTGTRPLLAFRRPARATRRRTDIPMCRIADGHLVVVDVDGELSTCVSLARSLSRDVTDLSRRAAAAARLGPLGAGDLAGRLAERRAALRELRLFDGKERKRSRYGPCSDCPALHECSVCPLAIAGQPGADDPDLVPPLPCAFNRLVARYRRRFPTLARA